MKKIFQVDNVLKNGWSRTENGDGCAVVSVIKC